MKMPRATTIFLAGLLPIVILLSISAAQATITCPAVIQAVTPCASFLLQNSSPSQGCCDGVKKLSGEAGTQEGKTTICQCLKQGLAQVGKYDPNRVSELPKDCGVPLTLPPIDQNTDCTK